MQSMPQHLREHGHLPANAQRYNDAVSCTVKALRDVSSWALLEISNQNLGHVCCARSIAVWDGEASKCLQTWFTEIVPQGIGESKPRRTQADLPKGALAQ